ncbi:hypothetical protein FJQ98_20890 [Lysinibacillus agricola]|uniref:Uncharacterized protein n=1 Tax=Lysinibacillus agricola TaxID=2590012 RepID=A0ABX7APX0_9BACI|nr:MULTISPECIES: hypothetical protein [Lysinibacillus]KOS60413.1 hypothetical protein AN161_23370 [Lysinibacillus sp. FJAT-14222]QQP11621.1 hypothetical protein FJQ98_20890 [Lysinibacillus agricola]
MSSKNIIIMIVALIVEVVITYFIASFFSVRFIEVMFFTGIAFAGGTFYFSSSGGAMTRLFASQASGRTGIIQKREQFTYKIGPIFTASVIFFLIGLVFFLLLISGIIPPQN